MASIRMFCHAFIDQAGTSYQARAYDDGRICSTPESVVHPGLVITDTLSNYQYILVDVLPILNRNRQTVFYYESLAKRANTALSVSRFTQGNKNAFGRDIDPAPQLITRDVPAFIHSGKAGLTDSPDGPQLVGKITATIPACDVQMADKILTDQQEAFLVIGIDRYTHPGLLLLTLEHDYR